MHGTWLTDKPIDKTYKERIEELVDADEDLAADVFELNAMCTSLMVSRYAAGLLKQEEWVVSTRRGIGVNDDRGGAHLPPLAPGTLVTLTLNNKKVHWSFATISILDNEIVCAHFDTIGMNAGILRDAIHALKALRLVPSTTFVSYQQPNPPVRQIEAWECGQLVIAAIEALFDVLMLRAGKPDQTAVLEQPDLDFIAHALMMTLKVLHQ